MPCTILRDEMMDVLYGEADTATARRVEEHHAACDECRAEMAAFTRLRRQLATWPTPQPARLTPRLPARGLTWLAAAAVLLVSLGAGMGFSGAELRHEEGRLTVRFGRSTANLERRLAEQGEIHRRQIEELRKISSPAPAAADHEELLRRVEELIRDSEARQAVLLNASLLEIGERSEAQRRYDLARVTAGLAYLDGRTGEQVARTNELMAHVLQASQQR